VQSGGFATANVADNTPKEESRRSDSSPTMVKHSDKTPTRNTRGRRTLRLEGDVVLDWIFQADGQSSVTASQRAFGHGLDEARSGQLDNKIQTCDKNRGGDWARPGGGILPARVRILNFDWLTEFYLRGEREMRS